VLKILIFGVLGAVVISCSSSKPSVNTIDTNETYKELVTNKLGEDVLYIANKTNAYMLCIKETEGSSLQPRNRVSYLVVEINTSGIVLEDKIEGGSVSWASKNEIEVFRTPGIVRKDQSRDDFITLYNVETGKSYPKKDKQTH